MIGSVFMETPETLEGLDALFTDRILRYYRYQAMVGRLFPDEREPRGPAYSGEPITPTCSPQKKADHGD